MKTLWPKWYIDYLEALFCVTQLHLHQSLYQHTYDTLVPLSQENLHFKGWTADVWKRHSVIPNKIGKLLIFLITAQQGFSGDASDHLPHKNVSNFFLICFG